MSPHRKRMSRRKTGNVSGDKTGVAQKNFSPEVWQ
jgi:hypothetical protein